MIPRYEAIYTNLVEVFAYKLGNLVKVAKIEWIDVLRNFLVV